MACAFVWDHKRNKVAYSTTIQSTKEGGLNIMDLPSRIRVCLLQWIRRSLENPQSSSAAMVRKILKTDNLRLALLTKQSSNKYKEGAPAFYHNAIREWFAVHNFQPLVEEDIRAECLWNNMLISSPRHTLNRADWHGWAEAGVTLVHHICHPLEDRLMDQEELRSKYNIRCNFLQALSLRQSIPHQWRTLLTPGFSQDVEEKFILEINGTRFNLLTSNPRLWYREFVRSSAQPFSRSESWSRELALQTPMDWQKIWSLPYSTTRETKLQSFAFKIIYRLTPCNKYLHTIRICESPTCPSCGEIDSISHFFYSCTKVKAFWLQVGRWCEGYVNLPLSGITMPQFILGVTHHARAPKIINWILLMAKFYIHRQRLFHSANFSLIGFLAEMKSHLLTERKACFLENKENKFRVWRQLLAALG